MLGLGSGLSGGYVNEWNPGDLGNKLIHWYKFNTGITTVTASGVAGQISQWADQKGSNNLAPAVTNDKDKMPKIGTDNSVHFNAATDSLLFGTRLTLGTFAIYGRFKSGDFSDRFLQQTDQSEFIKFQTTTQFRIQPGGGRHDMAISGDAGLANNTKFTAGFERDGDGDILVSANGLASETSANTATSNTVDFQEVGPEQSNLYVYEFIICQDNLSAAERTLVNAYLDKI